MANNGAKNKGGRPPKYFAGPRTHQSFGLGRQEKKNLALEATHYGITVTDLIRFRLGLPVDLPAGLVIGPPGKIYAQETLALEGVDAKPVMTFDVRPGARTKVRIWHLMPGHLADLQAAFPKYDILVMAAQAKAWIAANPTKRQKTADGMGPWLFRWISEERKPTFRDPKVLPRSKRPTKPEPTVDTQHTSDMFQLVKKHRDHLRAEGWPAATLEKEAMRRAEQENQAT